MFLKSIEMTGFKSFPERTIMNLVGSITGVVGPNGSGKSNVSDAVRWVLGEQSAKNLRGSVMQDVIFAGTQTRKPRSFCEVSLIFDNNDNRIGAAYSEIQVNRKLYRSGESEYSLNGERCRLKDILELFRDTGIGKEGYSIIGQGRIDEILSERSLDRRRVFEEASGIMKYRVRKEEAERKLEKTRFNLIRIEDILQEQMLRLAPLKRQADDASEYLDLSSRLRKLEISTFLHNYESGKERITKYSEAKKALEEEREQKEQQLKSLSAEFSLEQENVKELEITSDEVSRTLSLTLANIERVEGEIKLCDERMSNLEKDSSRINIEISESDSKLSDLKTLKEKNISRQKQIEQELLELGKKVQETEKESDGLSIAHKQHIESIEAMQTGKFDNMEKMTEMKSAESAFREKEQNIAVRTKEIGERLKGISAIKESLEKQSEALKNTITQQEEMSKSLKDSFAEKEKKANDFLEKIVKTEKALNETKREYSAHESSAKLLGDMKSSYEGYQSSVRKLMVAAGREEEIAGRIIGTFADLITVPQKYETAVESSLGPALQNIVVEDEYDAKHLISCLRRNDMGRVTFLPVKALKQRYLSDKEKSCLGSKGVCGVADELISCDDRAKRACQFLLGRTVIVEDADTAIRIMRENGYSFRTVTLEGDVYNPGGAITGGSFKRDSAGLVSRDRRETELKEMLVKISAEISKLEKAYEEYKVKSENNGEELNKIRQRIHEKEIDVAANREKLEAYEKSLKENISETEQLENLKKTLEEELESIKNNINRYTMLQSDMLKKSENESERRRRLEDELNDIAEKIDNKKRELHNAEIRIAELKSENASLQDECGRLEDELHDMERSGTKRKKTLELNSESLENLQKLKKELEVLFKQKISVNEEVEKRQTEILERRRELSKSVADKEEYIINLRQNLSEINEKSLRLDFNIEKQETGIQEAQNRLWDTYQLTYAGALPEREEIGFQEAQSEAAEIKEKIRDIGSINANAIEDYRELKERMQTLTSQKDDLIKAEEDLHKLIASLLSEMKKTFKTSFDKINVYFNQTFQELFDGGRAHLQLEDEENIMECRIEIIAEPPGKKLQKISLLSGGEKALTAICLLFALLKINPSPVCVLDEIDAALDEANVEKFADYLEKYAKKMQFIVITHRKPTMAICDSLYGFAMEEKGVSKLLSVMLD